MHAPYAHLLVPVDYTGCAYAVVDHAARLATAFGSKVTLLYVVDPPKGSHATDPTDHGTVGAALDAEATVELDALRAVFGPDLDVDIEVRHGHPVETICAVLTERGADLVVMGTHARTGVRRLLLGSVAEQVVRRAPVPVFVVRAPGSVPDAPSAAWLAAQAETEG